MLEPAREAYQGNGAEVSVAQTSASGPDVVVSSSSSSLSGEIGKHQQVYQQHKAVALRLRDRGLQTLSKADKQDLSHTRQYLRNVIRYNVNRGRGNSDKVVEAKDLLGHLQGGMWKYYTGPMTEEEVWRKSETDRVTMISLSRGSSGRKRKSKNDNESGKAAHVSDDLLSPQQLKVRRYYEAYKARQKVIRFAKYQEAKSKSDHVSSSTLSFESTAPLDYHLPGWKNRQRRNQTFIVR